MQNRPIKDQFHSAIKAGDVDQVERILSKNYAELFNYSINNDEYIFTALRNNDIKILNLFITYDIEPKHNTNIVSYAIENCTLESVKAIIKLCNPDLNNIGALHDAVIRGNIEIINYLLSLGADIDRKHDKTKESPVEIAMNADHPKAVKFLVDQGADIHIPTYNKRFLLAIKVKEYLEANKLYCNYQLQNGFDAQGEITKLNLKVKSLEDTVNSLQKQLADIHENQKNTTNNGLRKSIFK